METTAILLASLGGIIVGVALTNLYLNANTYTVVHGSSSLTDVLDSYDKMDDIRKYGFQEGFRAGQTWAAEPTEESIEEIYEKRFNE